MAAWKFERGEDLEDAFRRVAADEIARVREVLTSDEVERAKAIHQSRRSFKRLRALLRLAKPSLGDAFEPADERWRDAGRLLATSRDATVLLETFDRVAKNGDGELPPAHVAVLRKRISATVSPDAEDEVVRHVGQVVGLLASSKDEVDGLAWPASRKELCRGLKHSQKRLRKAWKAALDDPQPEKLHEWRKCVKDYTAQVSLVRFALPHELKVCRSDSRVLADILGEEHDLSILRERLSRMRGPAHLLVTRDMLLEAIDVRRSELCDQAFDKGEDLSSRKPKAFAAEIEARL